MSFAFRQMDPAAVAAAGAGLVATDPNAVLGPLEGLLGTWKGTGFNTIWRPNFTPSSHIPGDNILELNVTNEQLAFTRIAGEIPNRGMVQPDITLFGMTYLQQVADQNIPAPNNGIHIEPGIWILVPTTTNPKEPQTVVRMASIPHGTTITAQGVATTLAGPPTIPVSSIVPLLNGQPLPAPFVGEMNLAAPINTRIPSGLPGQPIPASLTQAMVTDPNSVLRNALVGQHITKTVTLTISTRATAPTPSGSSPKPIPSLVGGGTDNIAFLQGGPTPPNANAVEMDAIFWIETGTDAQGKPLTQLQYTQTVFLVFNGLTWPHVSVATLRL